MASQMARIIAGAGLYGVYTMTALLYVRVGLPILAMVPNSGPFSSVVDLAEWIVPIALGGLYLFTAYWVISGPVEKEQTAARQRVMP